MYASRLWSSVSVGLAAAVLGACSSASLNPWFDGGGWPDGGAFDAGADAGLADGGPSPEATCAVLDARRCAYLTRCGLIADTPAELAACLETLTQSWCGPSTWPAHVESGSLRLDPVLAAACAGAFDTRACADFATLPAQCGQFLLPSAGLHQECFDGFSECTVGVCRGAACPRTCQLPGAASEVCSVDDDCRTGLQCKLSTTTAGVGQCVAFAQVGENCDDATRCLDGLWCAQNKCRTVPTQGQSCSLGRCDDLSYCDQGFDGGLCEPRKLTGDACLQGQCLGGFLCSAITSSCLPLQVSSLGAPCTTEQLCPAGSTCLGATPQVPGTCGVPRALHAPCSSATDCSPELTCAGADAGASCVLRLGAGSACASSSNCQADALCLKGQCTALPGLGEPCALTQACRDGTCLQGAALDGGFLCTPLLGPAADCSSDAQCASGRCSQNACLTACTP